MYVAALADLDDGVTRLVTCVLDSDQTSLDVARHWGFQPKDLTITTSCTLTKASPPEPRGGVTVQACDDLMFDDDGAVETMLLASQTNPESATPTTAHGTG